MGWLSKIGNVAGTVLKPLAAIGGTIAGGIMTGKAIKEQKAIANEQMGLSRDYQKKADEAWKDYEVPGEIQEVANEAEMAAKGKSAVQSYIEENADIAMSNHLKGVRDFSTSGAQALASLNSVINNNNAAKRDAAIQGGIDTSRKREEARRYKVMVGDKKETAWVENHKNKYLQNLQFSQDLMGASYANKMNAANTRAQMGSALMSAGVGVATS